MWLTVVSHASRFGTLLFSFARHTGDVNALTTSHDHSVVFSSGVDGQVVTYSLVQQRKQQSAKPLAIGMSSAGRRASTGGQWVLTSVHRGHHYDVLDLALR